MDETQPASESDAPVVGTTKDERTWGMLCHLAGFSGYVIPFGNILGPLIVWSMKKDEYPMVADQGKESMNFAISFWIYALITAITIVGPLVVIVFAVVMRIIACIRANDGEYYRYPLTIRFIK